MGWTEEHIEDLRLAGFAYIRQGKYEIALPFFETLCLMANDDPYDIQTLGALYLQMGKPEKAIIYLDRALQMDTEHAPTLLNLAKAFFMLGRVEEGIKLSQILAQEPDPKISNPAKALILAYT